MIEIFTLAIAQPYEVVRLEASITSGPSKKGRGDKTELILVADKPKVKFKLEFAKQKFVPKLGPRLGGIATRKYGKVTVTFKF